MMMNEQLESSAHDGGTTKPPRSPPGLVPPRRMPTPFQDEDHHTSTETKTAINFHQVTRSDRLLTPPKRLFTPFQQEDGRCGEEEERGDGAIVFGSTMKPTTATATATATAVKMQLVGGQMVPRLPKRLPTPGPVDDNDDHEEQEAVQAGGASAHTHNNIIMMGGLVPPRRMPTPSVPEDYHRHASDDTELHAQKPADGHGHGHGAVHLLMPQFHLSYGASNWASLVLPERYGTPLIPEGNEEEDGDGDGDDDDDDDDDDENSQQQGGIDWEAVRNSTSHAARRIVPSPLDFNNNSGEISHYHDHDADAADPLLGHHDEEEDTQDPTPSVSPVPTSSSNHHIRPMRIPAMYKHDEEEEEDVRASARMERMILLPPTRLPTPAGQEQQQEQAQAAVQGDETRPPSYRSYYHHQPHQAGLLQEQNLGQAHPFLPQAAEQGHHKQVAHDFMNNSTHSHPFLGEAVPMMLLPDRRQPNPFLPEEGSEAIGEAEEHNQSWSSLHGSNHSTRILAPTALHPKDNQTSKGGLVEQQQDDINVKDVPNKPERRPTVPQTGAQQYHHHHHGNASKPDRRPTKVLPQEGQQEESSRRATTTPQRHNGLDNNSNRSSRLRRLQEKSNFLNSSSSSNGYGGLGRKHSSAGDIQRMQQNLAYGDLIASNSNFSWSQRAIPVDRNAPHRNPLLLSPSGGRGGGTGGGGSENDTGIPGSIQFVSSGASCDAAVTKTTRATRPLPNQNRMYNQPQRTRLGGRQLQDDHDASDDDGSSSSPNPRSRRSSTLEYEEDDFDPHHYHHYQQAPMSAYNHHQDHPSGTNATQLIQQTLQEAIASLGGVATVFPNHTTRPFPGTRPSPVAGGRPCRGSGGRLGSGFLMKEDSSYTSHHQRQRGQYLDDSKRTASTLSSTFGGGSTIASEFARMEIVIVQPPKPWRCVCGLEHEEEYRFCGFCGTSKFWTCSSCGFDRNKCQFLHCGGCGLRRDNRTSNTASHNNQHANALAA